MRFPYSPHFTQSLLILGIQILQPPLLVSFFVTCTRPRTDPSSLFIIKHPLMLLVGRAIHCEDILHLQPGLHRHDV